MADGMSGLSQTSDMRNLCSETWATTPGFKVDERELALREKEVPLDSGDAMRYRSCVMRLSYLALDRADLGEPVKCLARSMAKPTPGSLRDLKKVARYLDLWRQTFPKCISTYVDSEISLDVVRHAAVLWEWCK